MLICLLFAACNNNTDDDLWYIDKDTEILLDNGVKTSDKDTCLVITLGGNAEYWSAAVVYENAQNGNWISIDKNDNDGICHFRIHTTNNEEWNCRRANIELFYGKKKRTLPIIQEARKQIYYPGKFILINRDGGTTEVTFNANTDCQCSIASDWWDNNWVNIVSQKKEGDKFTVILKATENNSLGREKNLDISFSATGPIEHITIRQEPRLLKKAESIYAKDEGTLEMLMGTDMNNCRRINQLTLSGRLNSTDMAYLYKITNGINSMLKSIDMTLCTTSETGYTMPDGMFSHSNIEKVELPADLRCIPARAFHNCSSIDSIFINSSVKTIGNMAFAGCSSLTGITFDRFCFLKEIGQSAFATKSEIDDMVLPTANAQIAANALHGCKIKRLHMTECVPPEVTGNERGLQSTILYVPTESVDLYKCATFWKDFKDVLTDFYTYE